MGRSPCCNEAGGLKKGTWTAKEDQKLIAYIQQHGEGGWRTMPHKAGLQRCGKSCRLRWANYLRPDIRRGEFSAEEEEQIIQLQATLGTRWSVIARHLCGRTDNDIKNYWNTHLKKRLAEMDIDPIRHKQIDLPPSSVNSGNSNNVANPSNMADQESAWLDPEIRLGQPGSSGSILSTSAKLLNKVAAKLAPVRSNKMANTVSTPSHGLDAIKDILLMSTKVNPSNRDDDNNNKFLESASNVSEITSDMLRPVSVSNSTRILNKMATKLAPLDSLDMLRDGQRVLSKLIESGTKGGDTSVLDPSSSGTDSYNNTDCPISIPSILKNTCTHASSVRESPERTGILGMVEDEGNETLIALHQVESMAFESTASPTYAPILSAYETSEISQILDTFGGGGGAAFLNVRQDLASDCHDAIVMEPINVEVEFMEQFTNSPFWCSY